MFLFIASLWVSSSQATCGDHKLMQDSQREKEGESGGVGGGEGWGEKCRGEKEKKFTLFIISNKAIQ